MNNNSLKRRRPFGHEEAAAQPQDPHPPYSPSQLDFSSLPPELRSALAEAARYYGLSGHRLHQLASEEHLRKRPRIATGFPMAPQYSDVPDRTSPPRGDSQFAFLEGARLNSGLENLKIWVCHKCGGDNYEPIPEAPSFGGYGTNKPYAVEKPPLMEAQSPETYGPTALKAPTAPSYVDDAAMGGRYLPNYPVLQPQSRSVMAQPSNREAMSFASPVVAEGLPDYYSASQAVDRSVSHVDVSRNTTYVPDHVMASDQPHPQGQMQFADMVPYHHRSATTTAAPPPGAGGMPRFALASPLPFCSRESTLPDMADHGQFVHGPFGGRQTVRRGPFKTNEDREKTAQTRKIGSCVRCRMQRIRCVINEDDSAGPCEPCRRVFNNTKIWKLPCLRYKITDIRLFKPGQVRGFEWTRRWEDTIVDNINNWASMDDDKVIRVTEGYTTRAVKLRVRKFVPQEGDKLERSWVADGVKRSVTIPPYAIVDLVQAQKAYDEYIDEGLFECFNAIIKPKGGLLWRTYQQAWYMAIKDPNVPQDQKQLLTITLRLWMAIRLTTKSAIIVGDETLGMSRDIMDETSPIHGCIPLPPVMGAQLDLILIHQIQTHLRRELLDRLQKMLQSRERCKMWLTIYLVIFILLHNIALITDHDASYAQKHGISRRFAREDKVREYHHGANVLLAYFHYCNKGKYPFSPECTDADLKNVALLDEESTRFVRETRQMADDNKEHWAQIRRERLFENSYYFVSQLYQDDWEPKGTI